jgi:hypothetical protein
MSQDPIYEEVPQLNSRAGDMRLASQNNSTILLGRDRLSGVGTGYGMTKESASIHVVVGRKAGDPVVLDDAATLYLSQKSDPDKQAGTSMGSSSSSVPTAVLRADCVRIIPRKDLKISAGKAYMTISSDGKIVLDGEIQLGEGAADRIIRGDEFAKFWSTLTIPTPVGPSGFPPPLPQGVFSSRTVRVK